MTYEELKNRIKQGSLLLLPLPISIAMGVFTAPPPWEVEFAGVLAIAYMVTNGVLQLWASKIRTMTRRRVTIRIVVCSILFACLVGGNITIFLICRTAVEGRSTVFGPMWLTGEAAELVAEEGSRANVVIKWGARTLEEAIERMEPEPMLITVLVLLALQLAAILCVSTASGLLRIRGAGHD